MHTTPQNLTTPCFSSSQIRHRQPPLPTGHGIHTALLLPTVLSHKPNTNDHPPPTNRARTHAPTDPDDTAPLLAPSSLSSFSGGGKIYSSISREGEQEQEIGTPSVVIRRRRQSQQGEELGERGRGMVEQLEPASPFYQAFLRTHAPLSASLAAAGGEGKG